MTVPNQAAPAAAPVAQTNDEKIGSFARDVLNDIVKDSPTNALNPNVGDEAETQDTETPEVETPEAETPSPEVLPELVEVDIDGEKYQLPEKVKHRVMADKDYRQKTMELSASRKTLEQHTATAQKLVEQAQQLAPYHAQLFQMESRAEELGKALQSPELQSDPLQYNRVQGELAILLHHKERFSQGLQAHKDKLTAEQAKLRTEKFVAEVPELLKEFPDLAKPESRDKLAKYVNEASLPPEAIEFINYSAGAAKLAWKAALYDQMVKDQAVTAKKLKETVKTLPAAQTSRATDKGAKDQSLHRAWQKGGGKISDPNFDALLRSKLKG